MQIKETELGKIKEKLFFSRALKGSCIALAIFVLAFVFLPYIVVEAKAANTVALNIGWGSVELTFDPDYGNGNIGDTGHGDVLFGEITPTERNTTTGNYGTMKVLKKTLAVSTTGKYYTVYVSMAGSDQELVMSGDTGAEIPAATGTWASPAALTQTGWGFAVPGTMIPVSSSSASTPQFSSACNSQQGGDYPYLDTDLTVASGGACYTSVWAQVPVVTTPQQIWKQLDDDGFEDDTFDVFYATMVDTNVMAGTYQNEIVYTALASAADLDQVSTNMSRQLKMGGSGDIQTITFDLAESAQSSAITSDLVHIYVVPHSVMHSSPVYDSTNDTYDVSSLDPNDYSSCTIQTFSINDRITSLTCQMPQALDTDSDGLADIVDTSGTDTKGKFDYWIKVDGYGYNYVSHLVSGDEAFAYVGLQSVKEVLPGQDEVSGTSDDVVVPYVEYMQDMRPTICDNSWRWGKSTGYTSGATNGLVNGLRGSAVLFQYNGTTPVVDANTGVTAVNNNPAGLIVDDNGSKNSTVLAAGTFALTDSRDGKRYVVRRQVDGECWMAQNLNLDLYAGMTLSSGDTNFTSGRTEWTLSTVANEVSTEPDPGWTFDAGSTRKAWQTAHGLETVTLKRYTKTNGEWDSGTTVGLCEGGTEQAPCFAVTTDTNGAYYKIVEGTETAVTAEMAYRDGYCNLATCSLDGTPDFTKGAPIRGYAAGQYYVKINYTVKKINPNTTGLWTSSYMDASGQTSASAVVCSFSTYVDHLADDTACVLTTTGAPIITQFGDTSNGNNVTQNTGEMNGFGGVSLAAITEDKDGESIDFMNNTTDQTSLAFTSDTDATVVWPFATNAGDWRWERKGGDGAHIYDYGPVEFTTSVNDDGTLGSGGGSGTLCSSVGTTRGTLKNSSGNILDFLTCLDTDGKPKANSQVDGNWYNWYAATAGSTITNWSSGDAQDSICPKGWRLPNNSGDQSFQNLLIGTAETEATSLRMANSGSDRDSGVLSEPLSYVRSGLFFWYAASLYNRDSYGYYWLARSYSTTYSRYLFFGSSNLRPQNDNSRGYGFAVRCVAE